MTAAPATPSTRSTGVADDEPMPGEAFVLAAAMGLIVAGVAHLLAAAEHWSTSGRMSAFFIVVGTGQLLLGAGLRWRLPDSVVVAVVGAHLSIIGLYTASRTVDLPFVPPHGTAHEIEHLPVPGAIGQGVAVYPGSRVEPVGVLDLVCLTGELVGVMALTALLPPHLRGRVTAAMVAAAVAAVGWRMWVLS